MPNLKDLTAKVLTGMHRTLYRVSGGRIGNKGFGMPVVILTTTGRKSGKKRETMLTSPVSDDDRVVLVASYGGDNRHPAWYLNLRDEPKVELTMNGSTRPMTARTATPAEKTDLWPEWSGPTRGTRSTRPRPIATSRSSSSKRDQRDA